MKVCVNGNLEKKMKTSFQWEECPEKQTLQSSTGFSVPDKEMEQEGKRGFVSCFARSVKLWV